MYRTWLQIETALPALFTHAEIRFTNGTIEAAEACGPIIASGPMADGRVYKAFKRLRNLQGLSAERVAVRPSPFGGEWFLWWRSFPRWRYYRRLSERFIHFTNIKLTTEGELLLDADNSRFPPVPAQQEQIYNGKLKLSWSAGEIIIRATVTLIYEPDPNAYITGFMEGDMNPPIQPFLDRHVTATFNSRNPGRFGEPCHAEETETYVVEDFVLRTGLWQKLVPK